MRNLKQILPPEGLYAAVVEVPRKNCEDEFKLDQGDTLFFLKQG